MFQLNPHGLVDAWWQHLLMVAVAALLGYIIGFRSGTAERDHFEHELLRLRSILDHCKKGLSTQVVAAPISTPLAAVPQEVALDDLKVVEGIGPKIEKLLQDAGIRTWYELGTTPVDRIQGILEVAGPKYRMHAPQTWPQQALMAHQGKWQELKAWQDELLGGKPE